MLVVGNVATGRCNQPINQTCRPPADWQTAPLTSPPHVPLPPSSLPPSLHLCCSGKTSVINRFARNKFSKEYQTTIGVDFALKRVKAGGAELNVQLWDIAGQERFAGLSRVKQPLITSHHTAALHSHYRSAHCSLLPSARLLNGCWCCQIFYTHAVAAVIVYDITARSANTTRQHCNGAHVCSAHTSTD